MELELKCNYWQLQTWDECIHQIFQNRDFHDVVFVVETCDKPVSFPAHKIVLSMSSPMFAEMFYGPGSAATNRIVFQNIQPKIVEIMLSHIYHKKEVQFESLQQCFGVLKLATIYELSILRRICTGYIEPFIDPEHVCSVYEAANSVRNRNLALKCFQFMQKEAKKILKQDSWRNALPVTVEAIVKQEYLNIDNEQELFEAIISWAKTRAASLGVLENPEWLRQMIEPFLPHIRFFNMDTVNFLKILASTKVLNDEEITSIALNSVRKDSHPLPMWVNTGTNHRSYRYRTDASQNDWFNTNQEVYSHSDWVDSVCSKFKANSGDFIIDQLHIAICDDCFALNRTSRKQIIVVKVTIEVDSTVRERTIKLPISNATSLEEKPAPNFEKSGPVLIVRSIPNSLISAKCIGMETHAPIVRTFLDPRSPKTISAQARTQDGENPPISAASCFIEPLNFPLDGPLLVESEQRFKISIETESKEGFFCCRKKPSFEGAPFTSHIPGWKADESPGVWCLLEKLRYSVSK